MKIGIVVHGPNIIDSGYALKIINILQDFGEVHCRLGGTMGRTAVIDASLENLIDISAKRLPSDSVKLFLEEDIDVIVLLNYGKSSVTGHTFGFKVFKNSYCDDSIELKIKNKTKTKLNVKDIDGIDFIQIERPGELDGTIIHWAGKNDDLVLKLAKFLDLNILESEQIENKYFRDDLNKDSNKNLTKDSNKDLTKDSNDFKNKSLEKIRNIHGVSPNENIFVNGIVIGKSKSENLSLVSKNGEIVDIIGGDIKAHGIEKLGSVDIDKAIVKTGLLRKANPKPRIVANEDNNNEDDSVDIGINNINDLNNFNNLNSDNKTYFNVAFIDHAAEDIYSLKNFDLAVTIGDDTTLVASDILYRFNIPVIGITDGDLDKVVEKGYVADGSTIIELKPGFDDIVGDSIFKNIFNSKHYLKLPIGIDKDYTSKNNSYKNSIYKNNNYNKNIKSKIFEDFKKEVFQIANNITTEYKIK